MMAAEGAADLAAGGQDPGQFFADVQVRGLHAGEGEGEEQQGHQRSKMRSRTQAANWEVTGTCSLRAIR